MSSTFIEEELEPHLPFSGRFGVSRHENVLFRDRGDDTSSEFQLKEFVEAVEFGIPPLHLKLFLVEPCGNGI